MFARVVRKTSQLPRWPLNSRLGRDSNLIAHVVLAFSLRLASKLSIGDWVGTKLRTITGM